MESARAFIPDSDYVTKQLEEIEELSSQIRLSDKWKTVRCILIGR